jgi:hypothetical protein
VKVNSLKRTIVLENRIFRLNGRDYFWSKTWRSGWVKSNFGGKSFWMRTLGLECKIFHSSEMGCSLYKIWKSGWK